jgi:nitrite reductase (NO-forming)
VPTWAWVLLIVVVAFGIFYGVQQWSPTGEFARTPTYGTSGGFPSPAEAASAAAVPAHAPVAPASTRQGSTVPSAIPAPADAARGAALYSVNCAACHQNTGQGLPGAFPPLAGDPVVQAVDPTEHIITVLNGKQGSIIGGIKYASPMPAFKDVLNDDDLAAVLNHERTSWGNEAPTVRGADVARLRK